jgi:hypothetical protein
VGTLCQNVTGNVGQFSLGVGGSCPPGSNGNPAAGCPDGYKSLLFSGWAWQHGITVWRNTNYAPAFDPAYLYTLSPLGAPSLVLDAESGYLMDTAGSTLLDSSQFLITAHNSSWLIQMKTDPTKCVDAAAGTNSSVVHLNSCSGAASQSWNITADAQTGSFFLKTSSTGRCLHVDTGSTTAGAGMEVYDCSSSSMFQRFLIQAH